MLLFLLGYFAYEYGTLFLVIWLFSFFPGVQADGCVRVKGGYGCVGVCIITVFVWEITFFVFFYLQKKHKKEGNIFFKGKHCFHHLFFYLHIFLNRNWIDKHKKRDAGVVLVVSYFWRKCEKGERGTDFLTLPPRVFFWRWRNWRRVLWFFCSSSVIFFWRKPGSFYKVFRPSEGNRKCTKI